MMITTIFTPKKKKKDLELAANHQCRLFYQLWHFLPVLVLLKMTRLVILFDRKLKELVKVNYFWHF